MKNVKKYLAILSLSLGAGAIYTMPYIKYVFYDALIESMNITNQQLGFLLTLYSTSCILLYIPGGWVADRFSTRKILSISLFATGLLSFWFAFSLDYKTSIIIWLLFGFSTGFAYWAASIKAVRLVGDENEQGKMYGLFQGLEGLVLAVGSFISLGLYSRYNSSVESLKAVVMFYGFLNLFAAVSVFFLFKDNEGQTADGHAMEKVNIKDIINILKRPQTWLVSIIVFSSYGLYSGQTYLTPYLTDVLGLTVVFSGFIAIFRTYIIRFLSSPLGGYVADKAKSVSKTLIVGYILTILLLAGFIVMPTGVQAGFTIGLMLVAAIITFAIYGIMWATVEEANIPRHLTGITVGIASIIGYLPDSFMHTLFGNWLDNHGSKGYDYIFIFLIGLSAVGGLCSYLIYKEKRKMLNY